MSQPRPSKAKPRSRTFTGCLTCRARKVKCNLAKPSCQNCLRLGLQCPGYGVQLQWLPAWNPSHPDANDVGATFPGYHEVRRARTATISACSGLSSSRRLIEQLSTCNEPDKINQVLDKLDDQALVSEGRNKGRDWHISHGPFTILYFVPKCIHHRKRSSFGSDMIATPISPVSNEHFTASAFPINGDWFSSMLDGGDASYGLTTDPTVIDFNPTLFSIDDPSLSDSGGTSTTFFTNFGSENDLSDFVGPLQAVQPCSPLFAQDFSLGHPSASSLPNGSPYLPVNVRFLLSHYANHVISSLSLQPHNTPPWRGIHLPCALTAYGELDVVGNSSFARVSLLYSLLSLTCYHLSSLYDAASPGSASHITTLGSADQSPNVEFWSSQGLKFRNIARTAFHKCLGAMSSKPAEKVKYKELFASAMSLICTGIISGDPWDSRFFIIQCEDIVNKVGRRKRRFSDKALQLHRIFSFIRIIEQTTFVQTRHQYLEVLEKHSLFPEQTELIMQIPEDSFSPSATVASNLQSMADLGLTDAEEETFAQLYGMPGTILRLIARTNNMITQLDPPELHGTVQPVIPEDLIEAAADLENDICKFKQTSTSCHDLTPMDGRGSIVTGADASQIMRSHFTMAMHHALLVYFFRFVRGTNPIILQHYVGSVISNLESFQKRKEGAFSGVRIGTTVWPSFIAACEALGDDLRDRAKRCMRHAAWAGFKNAEAAEAVAQEVWRRRDQGEKDVSWSTVLRDSGTILLLT